MLIAQPYIIVKRTIKDNRQLTIETRETLKLYHDRIISASNHFYLDDILDMSYKPFSGNKGLLYFHTIRGVYSFHIPSKPCKFIGQYQYLKEMRAQQGCPLTDW
ncbi:hypothetical protein [Mesobacillus zeae]|uniref:Uncharacterized protein n=1 Tax=Mesobacillus zeae TaxID=1917180 RepID=A0A398AX70_9BACI|nr:hypothetical protein [Mesobacillus zeae]RID82252.1 hypothetical protein D1970_19675 [Mesobacillus zeae]